MKITRQARETMGTVADASRSVINTTEQASAVLLVVATVSIVALLVSMIALSRTVGKP